MKSHEGLTCEDVQSGLSSEVTRFVREIQENILNLRCPKCNTPFYDFSGCAAVFCETCKGYFCGLCFEYFKSDGNAHSHVRICPKNEGKEFFVAESTLNEVHRTMRKQKIEEFVSRIGNPKIRNNVCMAIKKDLDDLGINQDFIASLLLASSYVSSNESGRIEEN